MTNTQKNKKIPVVVIIGHVDHGKSTLLDYIRKTNIVDGEAGGITQKISAYQVEHGHSKNKITFIDTPGHEAFQNMRERSIEVADIAILIVSAEDGVKEQTMQAYNTAIAKNIPVIVAINKIDKPASDIDKTKNSLLENGIYLEGAGGNITYSLISAKNGQGVDELLENIILQSEINDINYNPNITATGKVLESFIDKKRGISATLIIKDGTLPSSGAILAGNSLSPIRIIEDFAGKSISSPSAGIPIMVTGFDTVPAVGSIFISSQDKKELETIQKDELKNVKKIVLDPKLYRNAKSIIPVILKSSSQLSLDAIKDKIKKYENDEIKIKIISEGIGNITEGDVLSASGDERVVILGFDVKIEHKAKEQGERFAILPEVFDIIYKLEDR
ncbi:MAG: GTP-binding protein [Cyanobium sp. MAG06]|nr:GTP-binding protein [Cyanobium sp. MAG06]